MPKKIGRYELGKTLGTGNFSKVKLGIDDQGLNWAIKIVDKAQLAKEHMEEQLKREIAVMKVLKHENIVQLREVLQTANHIYLVLELITGGELFDRIVAAKRFDEPTARKYFQQLVLGTFYCHQQGIAHRDLKPENLLLDGNDNLKISDFGLSNLQRGGPQGNGTLLQTVCGTPNYVAPEVLKEKGYNGMMADVWSCGVILFVMLAGYLPFDDPNMNHLFNKIERGDFRMAKNFTDPVKDIIGKMMTVDPAQRLTLEQVIAHPWFQEGFDNAAFQRSKIAGKVQVSSEQVSGAVAEAVASDTKAADKAAKAAAPPTPALTASTGMDAFDVMSRFTSGALNPLTAGTAGIVRSATRLLYGGGSSEPEVKEIVAVLEQMKANPKTKEGSLEIKGFVNAPKGLLTYVLHIMPTVSPQLSILELRRGRGDTFDFHEFYRQMVTALGAKVRSRELVPATK
jgi:hypothetical protein